MQVFYQQANRCLVNYCCASRVKLSVTRNEHVTVSALNVSLVFSTITTGSGSLLNLEFPITGTRSAVIQVGLGLSLPHSFGRRSKCSCSGSTGSKLFFSICEDIVCSCHVVADELPASEIGATFAHESVLQLHVVYVELW